MLTYIRRLLALLFTGAPLVAGVVAALSVRRDWRVLWMAIAATLVARLALAVVPAQRGRMPGALMVFAAAGVTASAVAVFLGARGVVGVAMVAIVLAGCATAGAVLGKAPPPI